MPFTTRVGLSFGCPADELAPRSTPTSRLARYGGLFASLTTKTGAAVAAAVGAATRAAAGPARTEPRTSTPFPADFCHLSQRDCPELAGVG